MFVCLDLYYLSLHAPQLAKSFILDVNIINVCVFSVFMKQQDEKTSFAGFLALIGRLLFYRPVWTKENQQNNNIRFIYVHFSAWHFAGSDLLWAGLVIRLFQAMQMNFGKLQLVLYRVAQHDENEEIKNKVCDLL